MLLGFSGVWLSMTPFSALEPAQPVTVPDCHLLAHSQISRAAPFVQGAAALSLW